MIRTLLKPLSFLPALLLMYMIFSFSSQTGDVSSQLSYKASCKIIQAADYVFDANLEEWQIDEWANKINFITRKLAHMAEYFALAVAVSFPLYVYGMHGILLMLVAGAICVGFACGDEYHQAFVAGRGPSTKDVCIDSIGVFFGIILVRIVGWTGRKTIFRPQKKKHKKLRGRDKKYAENHGYETPYPNNPQAGYMPYPPEAGYGDTPYSGIAPYDEHSPYEEGMPCNEHIPYGSQMPYDERRSYDHRPVRDERTTPDGEILRRTKSSPDKRTPYERSSHPVKQRRESPEDSYFQKPLKRSYGHEPQEYTPPRENPYPGIYPDRNLRTSAPDQEPYFDDWEPDAPIDIHSQPDSPYSPDWQDPSRANDWGLDDHSHGQEFVRQEAPLPPKAEPAPGIPPKKIQKKKKEKDWFFDI